jgi:hypothetical protein
VEFYKLKKKEVRQQVPKHSTGTYFLAIRSGEGYLIKYVGRSDTHLRQRLLTHVENNKYTHFSIEITNTIFEAFRLECREWHNSFPLDNKIHPRKPKRLDYQCPYCTLRMESNSDGE